jgi:hypothetical protein
MLWGRWLQLGVFAAALGACAIELQGEGDPTFGTPEATPPNPTVDGAVSDDASDCPSCAPGDELVEDSFDDDAHVDRLTSVALDAAGGTVQFPAAIDPGTGADGNCVVTYAVDLSQSSCVGRVYPDAMVSYVAQAIAANTNSLVLPAPLPGIAPKDEIVVVDAQGADAVVGKFEFRRVASVNGNILTTTSPFASAHAATAGSARVFVQRVPNYGSVAISVTGRIVAGLWNGYYGGLVALRAAQTLVVDGLIDVSGTGYRGGPRPPANGNEYGWVGESTIGGYLGSRYPAANLGGGGAGSGDACGGRGVGGGGGGHATAGTIASDTSCGGAGGAVNGGVGLLRMGSGGGSGGNDNTLGNNPVGAAGGGGGGVIFAEARTITVTGGLNADGAAGGGDNPPCAGSTSSSSSQCWDFSGPGGGGAGGTIRLRAAKLDLGTSLVHARGGTLGVGMGNFGGSGGSGRVFGGTAEFVGGTNPAFASEAIYAKTGRLASKNLLEGKPPATVFKTFTVEIAKRPPATKVRVLVSTDGTNWLPAMPPGADTLEEGRTTVPIDTIVSAADRFFYRLTADGDGLATPIIDRVALVYTP